LRIRFVNRQPQPCVLRGYPGVDGLARDGHIVVHADRTPNGYLGGSRRGSPRSITLRSGQTATALLEGLNGPQPNRRCRPFTQVNVTPPDETHDVRRSVRASVCYPHIHPLLPGSTGSDR
jgi:Protein of unknown function (DUF4232)